MDKLLEIGEFYTIAGIKENTQKPVVFLHTSHKQKTSFGIKNIKTLKKKSKPGAPRWLSR